MDKYLYGKNIQETKEEAKDLVKTKEETKDLLKTKEEAKDLVKTKEETKDLLKTKEEAKNLLIITGTNAKINGIIDISGDIELNCEVEGELKVKGKLVILKDAKISSAVTTQDVKIIGQYKGNMTASGEAIITKGGIMKGNIITDRLVINEGGIFSGKVTRTDEVNNENEVVGKFQSEDEGFSISKLRGFDKVKY